MPTSATFTPHRVSRELALHVTEYRDGNTGTVLKTNTSEAPEATDDMVHELTTSGWQLLELTLDVVLPLGELEEILPEDSDVDVETAMVLTLKCPATKFRKGVRLARTADGRWSGEVSVRRTSVSTSLICEAELVRIVGIDDEFDEEFGVERGQVLAEGGRVTVRFDPPPPQMHGSIDIKWEDFTASPNTWRKSHAKDIYYFEVAGDRPVVWLNSSHRELQAALSVETASGPEKVIQQMGYGIVAQGIWAQIFHTAVADLTSEDDLEPVVPSGWSGGVIRDFLPLLYPEIADAERLERLVDDLNTPTSTAGLMSRLGSAIQARMNLPKMVAEAIRAAETGENS